MEGGPATAAGSLCEALLRRRADVARQAHSGATATDFAESEGHKEAPSLLIALLNS